MSEIVTRYQAASARVERLRLELQRLEVAMATAQEREQRLAWATIHEGDGPAEALPWKALRLHRGAWALRPDVDITQAALELPWLARKLGETVTIAGVNGGTLEASAHDTPEAVIERLFATGGPDLRGSL